MEELDLQDLRKKLDERMNYPEGSEEAIKYNNDYTKIYEDDMEQGQNVSIDRSKDYKNLEDNKLKNIKHKYSLDENKIFLELLKNKLPEIKSLLTEKEKEHNLLKSKPTNPNFIQRQYTNITRKKNNAEINKINKDKSSDEIHYIENIKRDIEKLLSIYEADTTSGGKYKTRRNRRKSKSRKNKRKSTRRH